MRKLAKDTIIFTYKLLPLRLQCLSNLNIKFGNFDFCALAFLKSHWDKICENELIMNIGEPTFHTFPRKMW